MTADAPEHPLAGAIRLTSGRRHAIRQFEIYIAMLCDSTVPGPGGTVVSLGRKSFTAIARADLHAVFEARITALERARDAAKEVAALRAAGTSVPGDLRRAAGLASRSTKGGHVGLNRFKARVRHLFNWAIAQGYRDDTPFKRHSINVIRLNGGAETVRARRLQAGEEERLLAAVAPHLRALIVAALSTGCRLGELLDLQWRDVHVDERNCYRWFVLQGTKTKTRETRAVPIGQRLGAVLEMVRYDPAGQKLGPETYVFGTEVGDRIGSVKTAWRSACQRAEIVGLHFHDLRREFACRLLESRAELHDVRDFLGHANITTTSRYLRSTSLRLERALRLLEEAEFRTGATSVPHGPRDGGAPAARETPQVDDLFEDGVVSPEGIEPSTYRLRVCCSAN
jgi:integrase